MKKTDLIERISLKTGIVQKDVELVVAAAWEVIRASIQEEDQIRINGFGTFRSRIRPSMVARNLKGKGTKNPEPMILPPCKVAQFKPCKNFFKDGIHSK